MARGRNRTRVLLAQAALLLAGLAGMAGLASCASRSSAPIQVVDPRPAESVGVTERQDPNALVVYIPRAGSGFRPDSTMYLCSGITVSNAPPTDSQLRVLNFRPYIRVTPRVVLALPPTSGACMTSGFGWRNGKEHKGVDMQSKPPTMVYAAGGGLIREATYAGRLGNYVLIEHGDGVFTRYAHLAGFAPGIEKGAIVGFGTPLGMMGGTATPPVPVHLHFEVLIGEYDWPRTGWGLQAVNPFEFPFTDDLPAGAE